MLTGLAFMTGFLALLALAILRHPIFGLYAYLAAFYVHPPSRWWSQNLPDLRWALLAAAVTLIAVFLHRSKLAIRKPWFANVPAVLLVTYCVLLWIQNLWAIDPVAHFDASVQYTKYIVAFYLIYRILDTSERLRDFLLVHLGGCAYLGLQAYLSRSFTSGRLNGVGGPGIDDANTLGMFLATGVVAGAALVLCQKGWRRNVSFAALALIMNGLVLTGSRGGFLGLLGGGATVSALHPRHFRLRFLVLAIIAAVGFVAIASQTFISRMGSIVAVLERSEEMDASSESRFVLQKAQWQMFLDFPMGTGHKGFAALSPVYLEERWLSTSQDGDRIVRARSSHNTLFTTLSEQGAIGVTLFLLLVGWVFGAALRIYQFRNKASDPAQPVIAAGYCGGIMVVLVAGFSTDYLMAEVQFWLMAGLVAALQLLREKVGASVSPRPAAARLRVGMETH